MPKDGSLDYFYQIQGFNQNITYLEWHNQIYSTAGFHLQLKRHCGKYILGFYLPSMLFVVISWISFTIPPDAIPGRMALLVTLVLVLVNLFGIVIYTKPQSKSTTILEIWMLSCLIFVSVALCAYAIIMLCKRCQTWNKVNYSISAVQPINANSQLQPVGETKEKDEKEYFLDHWDKHFLIGFPLAFLVFNIIYWPIVVAR